MKKLVILLGIILQLHLWSDEISGNTEPLPLLIQSPLPFSKNLPVDVSQSNKKTYINNPELWEEDGEADRDFIKNKSLPWLPFTSTLATFLVIYYIRMLPARESKEPMDPFAKEKAVAEIRTNLQKIALRNPKDDGEAKTSIMQLNSLLRMYLHYLYDYSAFSYTAPELEDKIKDLPALDHAFKDGINKLFNKADRIKYAKEKATPEEFADLVKSFNLINNIEI